MKENKTRVKHPDAQGLRKSSIMCARHVIGHLFYLRGQKRGVALERLESIFSILDFLLNSTNHGGSICLFLHTQINTLTGIQIFFPMSFLLLFKTKISRGGRISCMYFYVCTCTYPLLEFVCIHSIVCMSSVRLNHSVTFSHAINSKYFLGSQMWKQTGENISVYFKEIKISRFMFSQNSLLKMWHELWEGT